FAAGLLYRSWIHTIPSGPTASRGGRGRPEPGIGPEAQGEKRPQLRAARSSGMASRQRRLRLDRQTGLTSSSTWSTTLPQNVFRNSNFPVRATVLSRTRWQFLPCCRISLAELL